MLRKCGTWPHNGRAVRSSEQHFVKALIKDAWSERSLTFMKIDVGSISHGSIGNKGFSHSNAAHSCLSPRNRPLFFSTLQLFIVICMSFRP